MVQCKRKIWSNKLVIGLVYIVLFAFTSYGQVGIGTTNPEGTLDVTTINNTGLVLPRVTSIEDVTDGNTNVPVNGTTVYDISRNTTCFYQNGSWICIGVDANGDPILTDETPGFNSNSIDYIKASNADEYDSFGLSLALSADGNTLAIGTVYESSNATGINGNQPNNSASGSGAVYVFFKASGLWSQEAYIKASNAEAFDRFGYSLTLSHNGNLLAVGAPNDDSNAIGVNGTQNDNSLTDSGAVYVFNRNSAIWTQQSYIKASNPDSGDLFGDSVAFSGDGNTLAVGVDGEDSDAIGINGNQTNNTSPQSGAVYLFINTGGTWNQQAYIKASNTNNGDRFGRFMALSLDGNTLAVGAGAEGSNATGINGNQTNNLAGGSGAVYVFSRSGTTWNQQAYLKASNSNGGDRFGGVTNNVIIASGRMGDSMSISNDGNTLAIGAAGENSNATGINGNQLDNSASNSGAVYVFVRSGTIWSQEAYIKASNAESYDYFGTAVSISGDGNTLAVSAPNEESNAIGVNNNQTDNSIMVSGAVYVFKRTGNTWIQDVYVKASNTGVDPWFVGWGYFFGYALALSSDGSTLAVGAPFEDSIATGINGNQTNDSAHESGAVYVYYAN